MTYLLTKGAFWKRVNALPLETAIRLLLAITSLSRLSSAEERPN